jgi:hypothetical protein
MRRKALAAAGMAFAIGLSVLATGTGESARAAEIKTLKERLFDKGSDEQRVNNCGVPPERRGTAPRPGCPAEGATSVPVVGGPTVEPAPARSR